MAKDERGFNEVLGTVCKAFPEAEVVRRDGSRERLSNMVALSRRGERPNGQLSIEFERIAHQLEKWGPNE